MGLEKFRAAFLGIGREARIRVLSALAHELTIAARAAYADDGDEAGNSATRLRAFNELLHRVAAQLRGYIERDPDIYPEPVFWDILTELTAECGSEITIEEAVKRAVELGTITPASRSTAE